MAPEISFLIPLYVNGLAQGRPRELELVSLEWSDNDNSKFVINIVISCL
jgi:hypothetical protein